MSVRSSLFRECDRTIIFPYGEMIAKCVPALQRPHPNTVRVQRSGGGAYPSYVCMTWWLLRGGNTRSHSELGREDPQRRWYCVLRRGRVGRCQVLQAHEGSYYLISIPPLRDVEQTPSDIRSQFLTSDLCRGVEQSGSSSGS